MIAIEKFGEKTIYGKKDIKQGDRFQILCYDAECIYSTAQVLRLKLSRNGKELQIQKFLMPPARQPWRILNANFEFDGANCGAALNHLFYHLDDYLKPKSRYDRSAKD